MTGVCAHGSELAGWGVYVHAVCWTCVHGSGLCAGRVYTDLVEVVQICAGVNVCSAEFVSVFVVGGVGFLSVCAKGGLG